MTLDLPAVLGGTPLRVPTRRTPEVGGVEIDYVRAAIETGDWEHDAELPGIPVASGLAVTPGVLAGLGVEAAALAAEFAAVHAPGQRVHVVPVSNGTRAITLGLGAISAWASDLGLRPHLPGGEVIVPALTWQGSAHAVLDRGLVPVLVDIDPRTLCLDPAAVAEAITPRTVAVLPVHLYGAMADLHALTTLCLRPGIAILEDCAHAQGASLGREAAGTVGQGGTVSLQGSKTLSAGEGGMFITTDERLADQVVTLASCGRVVGRARPWQWGNDRMARVAYALARAQLSRFPEQQAMRLKVIKALHEEVGAALTDFGVSLIERQDGVTPPTYKLVLRVHRQSWGIPLDRLMASLSADLDAEVTRLYEPVTASGLYLPHTDPAWRQSPHWSRIDPTQYEAPEADEAYASCLAIEHAALLDPDFPYLLLQAVRRAYTHRDSLATLPGVI